MMGGSGHVRNLVPSEGRKGEKKYNSEDGSVYLNITAKIFN